MNCLFRLNKNLPILDSIPLKYVIYLTMLSNSEVLSDEDTKYAVFKEDDVYDRFSDWTEEDVYKALSELGDEGLVLFDSDVIYLGELRGRKFFSFESKSSLYDYAYNLLLDSLKVYSKSKSIKDKSRARYIKDFVTNLNDSGVSTMKVSDFNELHGYLYELYTGGEVYTIRNKIEYYQVNNMLKAYDKSTVFAILVEGTLHYDSYRKKGVPDLVSVAVLKDEIFGNLISKRKSSKEYMRNEDSLNSEF